MVERFEGKVVLVTGAGSGIGRASAQRFYAEGANVFLVDINAEGLADTMVQMPDSTRVHSMVADISLPEVCHATVTKTVEAFGQLDVLCNIAGILADRAYRGYHPGGLAADFAG